MWNSKQLSDKLFYIAVAIFLKMYSSILIQEIILLSKYSSAIEKYNFLMMILS